MKRLALILLAVAVPLPAAAQSLPTKSEARPAATLAGSWALKVDGATVFRFDVARTGDDWAGTWVRAKSFASTGDSFSRFSDETVEIVANEGKSIGAWAELTFPDNRPRAVPDKFRFHLLGADRVEMIYADTGLAPFTLVRVPSTTQLGPFEAGKVYRRVSVEMLGLPPDPAVPSLVEPDPAAAPKAAAKAAPDAWTLPPRQIAGPPAMIGR
ncbi:MAG: hypothetical protein ABIT09_10010 [Croceibacterium sp.]